ncbi:MAG: hypothetical protein M1827_001072 [Pycnora praestabilis]|nr:MAG: hypothetical protein M1827_001072 [Pycnora praestabilis]
MGQLGDLSPGGSVAVGVFVGLISTSVQSLGLTLQRKSHILEDEKGPQDIRRPPHRRRRWQLGMLMFIIANIVGSTIQITTLPLPVLSTLQASGLVFNSICATLILAERFTRWSLIGTILVSIGAVLIAIFGALKEPAHNLDQLLILLGRQQFILWMIGQALIVILIIVGIKAMKLVYPRSGNSPRMRLIRGMAYGSVSGVLSAHTLLVAKSAVELLVRTIVDRVNQFNRWQSWMILLGLVALALSQLFYLHCGLKLCSTSILYPFVFCIYNIIAILDGLIYFKQVHRLSELHAILIALGTVILLCGVFALSWRLDADPVTQQASAQTGLGPGMGFVDDTSEGEDARIDYITDEEEAIESNAAERQPLLRNGDPMTPTTKDNNILSATRPRRQGVAEADEIWGELEDDAPKAVPAPFVSRRRSSILSAPPRSRRRSTGMAPTESSSLLRSQTMKSYGYRRRSRQFAAESASRSTTSLKSRDRKLQGAIGGFWEMRWWKRRKGGDQDRDGVGDGENGHAEEQAAER